MKVAASSVDLLFRLLKPRCRVNESVLFDSAERSRNVNKR